MMQNDLRIITYIEIENYKLKLKMIEKKSFIAAIKRALQTGTFNFVGQQATQFPKELCHLDDLKIDDQKWWECNPILRLDFSNNSISSIPQQIVIHADIQLIRMKNNLLQTFPKSLISLKQLKSLDLSKNKLAIIPQELSYASALVQLNLSDNQIEYIPSLVKIKTLELVFIDSNKLTELPIMGSSVKKIEAASNKITRIYRQQLQFCENLEQLNLNKNFIDSIEPGTFENLRSLVSIQLKENRLPEFKQIPNSTKLDTINLAFNRLTQYSSFGNTPNLTVLILADNKIKLLSPQIIKLQKLKTLDISNNDLSDLPCQLGFINSLVRIQLEGNPLKCIRQNIRTGGTNVLKKYLQDKMDPNQKQKIESKVSTSFQKVSDEQYQIKLLNQFDQNGQLILRKLNLITLPQKAYQRNLRGLNLSENQIENLSQNISKFESLKYLIVNNNLLKELPLNLSILPNLQQIQAKHNSLSSIDVKSLNNPFPQLHYLDLSTNKIQIIPKSILLMRKLRTLHLSYNNIIDIQCLWNINHLSKLQILDVSNNQIEDISDNVFQRYSINYLNFQNNNLKNIPSVIGFMKLSGFKINGNPLKLIKRIVIDKGTVAILQYLRTRHTGQIPQPPKQVVEPQPIFIQEPKYEKPIKITQRMQIQQHPKVDQKNHQQVKKRVIEIQAQISGIQRQIQINMSMNNMQKVQKKKRMQALMIQKNKLLK